MADLGAFHALPETRPLVEWASGTGTRSDGTAAGAGEAGMEVEGDGERDMDSEFLEDTGRKNVSGALESSWRRLRASSSDRRSGSLVNGGGWAVDRAGCRARVSSRPAHHGGDWWGLVGMAARGELGRARGCARRRRRHETEQDAFYSRDDDIMGAHGGHAGASRAQPALRGRGWDRVHGVCARELARFVEARVRRLCRLRFSAVSQPSPTAH